MESRPLSWVPLRFLAVTGLVWMSVASPIAIAWGQSLPQSALQRLRADSTRPVIVRAGPGDRTPSFVVGRVPAEAFTSASRPAARGWDFWTVYGEAFGVLAPREELAVRSLETDALGMTTLRYEQGYRGLPVFGRQIALHFRGGAVTVINGEFSPGIDVSTAPSISGEHAARVATDAVPARVVGEAGQAELLIYIDDSDRAHLAWTILVPSNRPIGLWRVFVDAHGGEVVSAYNDLHTAKNRNTYTNSNDPDCPTYGSPSCVLPGTLVRTEGGPASGDSVVNAAHDHSGTVYDYYSTEFGRDSYDGFGHAIRSTVHFGVNFNNAAWCPDACAAVFGSTPDGEQMVYGDGDGTTFSPLAADIDVVAHELTHAVTESEAALIYEGQSGALNESYSDIFATMIDTGDWTVGEDSYTPGEPGDALRSLADPSAGGQPEHMSQFVHTAYDSGGIHINSGIPNHAAYLTSQGAGYGIGRSATQDIYYRALTTYLTPTSDFLDNLNALLLSASDLFPGDATKTRAVARAHAAVGIANPPAVSFPNGGEVLTGGAPTTITWASSDMATPFRVSSVQVSPSSTYAQGFEAGSALPSEFQTTGTAGWTTDASTAASGIRSARSGTIGNDGWTELSLTRRLTSSATMSFKYRVSSEAAFDFFSFYIDGEQVCLAGGACERSGEVSWTTWSGSISAGTHSFTWVYEKDVTVSSGSDRAWIDDISIPNVENVSEAVINASTPAGATSQAWTTPATNASNFKVRVQTLGVASWFATDDSNATFSVALPTHSLTVSKSGPESGTVTSSPAGINCGGVCSASFFEGTDVTLTALPAPNSVFTGWSGAGCSGTGSCFVDNLGADTIVTAAFAVAQRTLTISRGGAGWGSVTSSLPGIICGSDCSEAYPHGTSITLTATPATGSSFGGWSGGGCSGTGTCLAAMDADKSITATFNVKPASQFSIANAKKREGDTGKRAMKFTVTLSPSAGVTVTVGYITKNGKARAPGDYLKRNGTLTFAPGETTKTIIVFVRGDQRPEDRERLYVLLINPSGASIFDGSATGVIMDDEPPGS
jgi:bacillolysin